MHVLNIELTNVTNTQSLKTDKHKHFVHFVHQNYQAASCGSLTMPTSTKSMFEIIYNKGPRIELRGCNSTEGIRKKIITITFYLIFLHYFGLQLQVPTKLTTLAHRYILADLGIKC